MKKIILAKLFLFILTVAATLISAEFTLRIRGNVSTDIYKYDAETGLYILKPNSRLSEDRGCFNNLVRANSQGFHDLEFSYAKPEDVFRIVILGDSVVEGRQVAIEKSFHYLLEEKLNRNFPKNKRFEVLAFGIGGNGNFRNYLYLNQYALRYKPDLIILSFLAINDLRDDYELASQIFDKEGRVKTKLSEKEKLISKSVLAMWVNYKVKTLKQRWGGYFKNTLPSQYDSDQLPFDFQVFLKDYPQGWNNIWNVEKQILESFGQTAKNNGAEFFIISVPDLWRIYSESLPRDKEYNRYLLQSDLDLEKPEKILQEFAQTNGISYLNSLPIFKERASTEQKMSFYWPCDGHWNETGHLWAAEAISGFLAKNQQLLNN